MDKRPVRWCIRAPRRLKFSVPRLVAVLTAISLHCFQLHSLIVNNTKLADSIDFNENTLRGHSQQEKSQSSRQSRTRMPAETSDLLANKHLFNAALRRFTNSCETSTSSKPQNELSTSRFLREGKGVRRVEGTRVRRGYRYELQQRMSPRQTHLPARKPGIWQPTMEHLGQGTAVGTILNQSYHYRCAMS
ncbi:hypothetical protein B0J14DRAFT_567123 [Halenospora varia]|nr:hypothetical protein B0J14DRAFT_567123 [Halenospora varia]